MSRSLAPRLAISLFLASLAPPAIAPATPGDHLTSSADVLCTADDRVALLIHTAGNAGTYYITDNRWHLVMIDAATQDVQWRDHGAVVANTVNMLEEGDEPEVSYRPGDAPPLGTSLGEWGMVSCGTMDASHVWGPTALERFGIAVSEAGVFLTLGDHRRELEISGTWDPSMLANDQFPWSDGAATLASEEPISYMGDSEGLDLLRVLPLKTRTVFLVERRSEFGNTHIVISTPRPLTTHAKAWLVNSRGLDDHRAGHPERSAHWFAAALDLDPTFTTARYNLACAHALQADAPGAVYHLLQLDPTAELKAKIDADADFEPIRTADEFTAFIKTLP